MPKSAIAGSYDHYFKKETTNLLSRVILLLYISISDVWVIQFLCILAAAAAKSLQSCLTLCDSIDGSPPGSPIPGILQARTLEWVAISFSNAGKWKVKMKSLSCVRLLVTPWTAAHQAPQSLGFSREESWSGVGTWTNLALNCGSIADKTELLRVSVSEPIKGRIIMFTF